MYELTFYLADTLYYSQNFDDAVVYFERVRDSGMNDEFVQESATNAVFAYENGIKAAVMRGDFEEFMIKTSAEREPGVEVVPRNTRALRAVDCCHRCTGYHEAG